MDTGSCRWALLQSHRVARRGRRLLRRGRGHPRPHREGRRPWPRCSAPRRPTRSSPPPRGSPASRGRAGSARAGARSPVSTCRPRPRPGLTVADVDATARRAGGHVGHRLDGPPRRAARRRCSARRRRDEQRFLQRLLTGELRQGALEGVMLEAVAAAAEVPAATVRRAFLLSGRLPETARLALAGGAAALEAVAPEVGRPVRPMLASPGREPRRRARRAGPRGQRRVQAGRRPHPGAPRRRRRCGCGRARCARSPTGVPELVELVRGAARSPRRARRRDPRAATTTAVRARSRRR